MLPAWMMFALVRDMASMVLGWCGRGSGSKSAPQWLPGCRRHPSDHGGRGGEGPVDGVPASHRSDSTIEPAAVDADLPPQRPPGKASDTKQRLNSPEWDRASCGRSDGIPADLRAIDRVGLESPINGSKVPAGSG